ncbi:MAG: galactokinase family protein, partial [Rhodothermales bacterium]|nr:galactokinase family protein [Rhodothermales bacterium]
MRDVLQPPRVPLSLLANREHVESLLTGRGVARTRVTPVAGRFTRCARELLKDADGAAEAITFFVPGRIEVLGKHTDYAGGRSLTCATEHGFCV